MNQRNKIPIREVRIENGTKLGDLYRDGTKLYLIVKSRGKVSTVSVDDLIKELTRDLPPDIPTTKS